MLMIMTKMVIMSQVCDPRTEKPLADIWDVNHWVALRRLVFIIYDNLNHDDIMIIIISHLGRELTIVIPNNTIIMIIMSIVIMNDIMIKMRIITRQERFAEMFGSENTSKLIPSTTQVRHHGTKFDH